MASPFIEYVSKDDSLHIFGIRLLGASIQNGRKLLLTLGLILLLWGVGATLHWIAGRFGGDRQKVAFWSRQGIKILLFVLGVVFFVSIWFDNPARLATGAGLIGAGLAFAMQKVVTSFAGYIVILRGKTFNVGDRITMGGVRGDVIALNFIQTVIMEMGEPPAVQQDDPGMWIHSRQYSGRIVTISNAEIFEQPVYNYTRDFPFIWEEMLLPVSFRDDRKKAEEIMLAAVRKHTEDISKLAEPELAQLKSRYFIEPDQTQPRVFLRITDNWVELAVRFLCRTHDIRGLKDRISREMLSNLEAAKIGIASGTYDIVGLPPVRVEVSQAKASSDQSRSNAA